MPASIAFLLCFSERATILHGRNHRNFCKGNHHHSVKRNDKTKRRKGRKNEVDLVNHTWSSSTACGSRFWRSPSSQRSYTTTPMLEIKFIIRAAVLRDCISDGVCVGGRKQKVVGGACRCEKRRRVVIVGCVCMCRQAPDYQQVATPCFIGFLNPSMHFVELFLSRLRKPDEYLRYRLLG
jgi:hypothetical protein